MPPLPRIRRALAVLGFSLAGLRMCAGVDSPPAQAVFFVSPKGSDGAPGTREAPLRTIERARDEVRRINRSMVGDIVVYLRAGIYELDRPLEFGPDDSGTDGFTVWYRAFPGEKPVISGGKAVSGWTPDRGRIYKASLDRAVKLRYFYVNGVRAQMAQTLHPIHALGPWGAFVVTGRESWAETPGTELDGLRFPAAQLPVCSNPGDVELVQAHSFNEEIVCARGMASVGGQTVVGLQQPCGAIAASLPRSWDCGLKPSGAFTVRNAYELLSRPGQFYFNRATRTLYYYSRGEDMARAAAVAPSSEGLIRIAGRSTAERAHDLGFEGITFAYDDWQLEEVAGSHGFAGVQSLGLCVRYRADGNHHEDRYDCLDLPQATVDLRNCGRIVFERDRFEHLGGGCAISLTNDVVDSTVEGNVFLDLAGNAVNVGHPQHYVIGGGPLFPPGVAGVCARDRVSDNFLRQCCREFHQEEAISGFFTEGTEILHNDIEGTPYGGIALGWWWGNAGIPPSTVPRDNVIADNRVVDTQRILSRDGGAIYVLGEQPGGRIEGNYLRGHTRLIYPDDGSSGWTIERNVTEGGKLWFHAWVARIHDLTVRDNFTDTAAVLNRAVRCPLLDTHFEPSAPPWSPAARAIIASAGLEPAYRDLPREPDPLP